MRFPARVTLTFGSLRRAGCPQPAVNVEAVNDRLAQKHSIDDYYERSPAPIRFIEQRRLTIVRRFVGPCAGLDILEVGSGGGHVLRMFGGAHLTAIDVSDVFLDTARKNLAGHDVRFIKGEVDKLDLPPASFDRVICTEVLEHTEDPPAIMQAIAKLVRPGGAAIFTVPNDPLITRVKAVVRRTPVGWVLRDRINWGGDEFHIHAWTPREFATLLRRFFTVTETAHAPFDWFPVRACFRCIPRQ